MMMTWTGVILLVCLAPIVIWLFDRARTAREQHARGAERHLSD
jgi:hypothetical protein